MQIIKIGVDNVPQSVKDGVEQYVATMKRNGLKVGPIVVTASHQRSAYSSMMAGYGLSMSPAMVVRAIEMVDATPVAIRQILSGNKSPLRKRGATSTISWIVVSRTLDGSDFKTVESVNGVMKCRDATEEEVEVFETWCLSLDPSFDWDQAATRRGVAAGTTGGDDTPIW